MNLQHVDEFTSLDYNLCEYVLIKKNVLTNFHVIRPHVQQVPPYDNSH